MSFESELEAIGLELCRKLSEITQKLGKQNFSLYLRFGNTVPKQPRWDKLFIRQELQPFAGEIARVFVCGAPEMNETFDKALEELQVELKIDEAGIEIM